MFDFPFISCPCFRFLLRAKRLSASQCGEVPSVGR